MNAHDEIFKCCKPCHGQWQKVDGLLKQIDGGRSYVYGVNKHDEIFTRPVDGSGYWRRIPGLLKHVTASGSNKIYGVNAADQIWQCAKPCYDGAWQSIPGRLAQCDASTNGLFGVNSDCAIFRRPI